MPLFIEEKNKLQEENTYLKTLQKMWKMKKKKKNPKQK